jgi:hypothetical protein
MIFQPIDIEQEYKTFTVREIFEAIKKNGFEHLREQWYSFNNDGKAIGGCVLGQAALNLNVPADSDTSGDLTSNLWAQLNQFDTPEKWIDSMYPMNTRVAGKAIVYWNDHRVIDPETGANVTDADGYVWTLPTYNDVVEMAREVLEPHFDETIKLPHVEY